MGKRICLDAGHYGKYNRSNVAPEFYESEFNWKFHLLLRKYLQERGFEVTLTRADKDTDKDLYERGRLSKGHDLFLSIHANWADRASADYPVAYVPINGSGDAIGLKLAKCIEKVMGTKEAGYINTRRSTKGPWDWYGVIYGAVDVGVPGIILEHSFYSNERSVKWLMDDGNLEELARAEADVLAQYYGTEASAPEEVYTQEQFIRDVQEATGAKVDGKAGPETISKTVTVSRYINRTHSVVRPIQKRLYALGYTEVGEADGRAGPMFEKAVKNYQRNHGRNIDGEVTAKNITWRKLLGME